MFLLLPEDRLICRLTSEQIQYVPKIILLERYGDYVEGLWDRLPEHLRRDPEVQRLHRGEDCVPWFVGELGDLARRVKAILESDAPMRDFTPEQREELRDATALCHVCGKPFMEADTRVRDHCHLTGRYRDPAHSTCNLNYKDSHVIPVIFHNLSGYDAHFIIEDVANVLEGSVELLLLTKERYIAFTKNVANTEDGCGTCVKLRFVDTYKFLSASLDTLASYLDKSHMRILRSEFLHLSEDFELLTRKGVFPYEYVDSAEKLLETRLPQRESFHSSLTGDTVFGDDYAHAITVWNRFSIETLGQYSDLYLKTDVLLLADVFQNFRETCIRSYGLDPAHYYTLPGYTWDAMLLHTGIEFELLTDVDMVLFVERGVRGGLSQCSHIYARANNRYAPSNDPCEPSTYLMYYDVNNLYGWAVCQPLPRVRFRWIEDVATFDVSAIPADSLIGYILEIDLEYPRTFTKNDFEKNLYKLMNNAVFGKTMENVRNRADVKLVTRWDGRYGAEALIARPNFHSRAIFGENLLAVKLRRLKATFNRPIYVGMFILDISKTRLYEFHYEYMAPLYGEKCRIMYTGTDSLIYSIDGLIGTGVSGAASRAGVELISGDDVAISLCRPIFSFCGVTIADVKASVSSCSNFLFTRDASTASGSSTECSTNRFNGSTIGLKIPIQQQDLYTLPCESYFYIEGTFSIAGTAAGEGVAGATPADQARLVNNCAAFLFDEIRYELNGVEIDRSRNVGFTSTLKSYVVLTHAHANILQNAGWSLVNTPEPGDFNLCVPLGMLLVFCEDYRCVVINARHELVRIRARNDNNCVVLSSDRHEPKIDLHKDASLFDECDLSNVKLFLNSEFYSYDDMHLDFTKNRYAVLYDMYTRFRRTYYALDRDDDGAMLTMRKFLHCGPFVVIDCSRQNEAVKSATVDVRIEFDCRRNVPPETTASCLILHDRVVETGYKYLEIGIGVPPTLDTATVHVAMVDTTGKEILLNTEMWKGLVDSRAIVCDYLTRANGEHVIAPPPLRMGDLSIRFASFNGQPTIRLDTPSGRLTLSAPTVRYLYGLRHCAERVIATMASVVGRAEAKLRVFKHAAAGVEDPSDAPRAIRDSKKFDNNDLLDCELLVVVFGNI
ncbi:hypothetical protein DMN91_009176 [Ooceraea biroi]|uniref:DNA-directed DNA polymerase n=1 Tax=Ooceraea biroi TaxID=2015173 RepID=A0A3L8DFY3_OOCBI|nr:hypothetical protein DMN91_009176 [Ooceraea biroi]